MNRREFISTGALLSIGTMALPDKKVVSTDRPPSVIADIPLKDFLELSRYLTGEDELDAGIGADYQQIVASHPQFAALVPGLMAKYQQIKKERDIEAAIKREIMGNPVLRVPAEQIIYLWYVSALYISNPLDPNNTATGIWQYSAPQHYRHGLVWSLLGAHAPMTYGGSFGHWKDSPK